LDFWFAILRVFIRAVARAALLANLLTGGKENWMMAHPEGFR
jgi:hypothetical protein